MTELSIEPSSIEAIVLAAASGVLSHIFLFRFGEWDLAATKFLGFYFSLLVVSTISIANLSTQNGSSIVPALKTASALTGSNIAGIFLSMMVYRAFFHRLCRFPGPFVARLSNFYVTSLSFKKLHLYEEVQKLHEQYGDIVRIAPSELSINIPEAVAAIHSNSSPCWKGPWYNVLHPMVSLQLTRDKKEHMARRKVWDRGFSTKALRDYEPRVSSYTEQLLTQLERMQNTPVDVSKWFNFYSFDVMGDLAFGKSFGMLKDGKVHYFMKSLHADMQNVGLFSHLLWLFPIFKATPILNNENKRFWTWVRAQIHGRMDNEPDRPDVFSWILESYRSLKAPTWQDTLNLYGDGYLIVVAGSDTTAASLSCIFYHLALDKRVQKELQREIDDMTVDSSDGANFATVLSKLKYLQAVIDETLRMHPPVPSGVQRLTPPEGLQIGQHFIPGETIVQIPTHTMFRDERVFPKPNDFIPERWTDRSDLVKDASVFVPFSTGRDGCVGKQLGLMEVRMVTARIMQKWDVSIAKGQDPQAFLDGKKDTFTLALAGLNLVFTPRAGTNGSVEKR